jgi:hypothetical protein
VDVPAKRIAKAQAARAPIKVVAHSSLHLLWRRSREQHR